MPPSPVTLGLVQMRCGGSPEDNMLRAISLAERAQASGAQVVVLPELFQHPYFCHNEKEPRFCEIAEKVPGPTTERLSALARRLGVVIIGGTMVEQDVDGRIYNTATVFEPDGRLLGSYRKSHIPMDEGFYEQAYFSPGKRRPGIFTTAFGRIGVMVCYDQWFPEMARQATLAAAELLVYPSAIGDVDHMRFQHESNWQAMWLNAHLGHAAVNNVFVAAANRVGQEGRITFWGGSFVLDPSSRIVAQAGCAEDIVMTTCDLGQVQEMQEAWRFLKVRSYARA